DQHRQCRAHWALHLVSAWGLRTDRRMVERLEQLTRAMLDDHRELLLQHKLLEPKKGGGYVKKQKRAVEYAARVWAERGYDDISQIPANCLTKGGKSGKKQLSLSEDAAETLGDPVITAFQQYSSASTILDRVNELKAGIDMPIHTRFDELMVSGR